MNEEAKLDVETMHYAAQVIRILSAHRRHEVTDEDALQQLHELTQGTVILLAAFGLDEFL